MQKPAAISAAKRMQPGLFQAVNCVRGDKQRLVEENLLGLGLADIMLFNALAPVARVPVKTLEAAPVNHFCI